MHFLFMNLVDQPPYKSRHFNLYWPMESVEILHTILAQVNRFVMFLLAFDNEQLNKWIEQKNERTNGREPKHMKCHWNVYNIRNWPILKPQQLICHVSISTMNRQIFDKAEKMQKGIRWMNACNKHISHVLVSRVGVASSTAHVQCVYATRWWI